MWRTKPRLAKLRGLITVTVTVPLAGPTLTGLACRSLNTWHSQAGPGTPGEDTVVCNGRT
eukprot:3014010-Rhodomonas_salina.2